ncbi:hypothetical protein Vadar_001105 [Vaccinium darrowii]|uniref:Uncharacterized protein n=1 Tax=Vaccinium darrowii TaxID=229202 RepID=A0ACB7Z0I5_9ERIC|nr:hypothetical protein Vadar_001105 [Vaccinium darrowii]
MAGNRAWIQMGDFNSVRLTSERLVGFDAKAADEFNDCLTYISQDDLPSKGFWFTWTNKRGGSGDNKSRIDRVIANTSWMDLFPYAEANFLAPGISDHCSISVCLGTTNLKRKPFNFFNFWMQHPEFEQILHSSWSEPLEGRPMFVLAAKLKRLKGILKQLNLRSFSNITRRVIVARDQLEIAQQQLFATPFDPELCRKEKEMVCHYIGLRNAEESFMKQRSRVKWLALGDKNTSFFHQKLCAHRARNSIQSLHTTGGTLIEDPDAIKNEIVNYYTNLLGTPFSARVDARSQLQEAIKSQIPMAAMDQLGLLVDEDMEL